MVRSDSTDDIACWSIDTAYDDRQFFVGHANSIGYPSPGMNVIADQTQGGLRIVNLWLASNDKKFSPSLRGRMAGNPERQTGSPLVAVRDARPRKVHEVEANDRRRRW